MKTCIQYGGCFLGCRPHPHPCPCPSCLYSRFGNARACPRWRVRGIPHLSTPIPAPHPLSSSDSDGSSPSQSELISDGYCVTILPARAHFARSWPRQTPALSPSDLPIVAPTRLCPCTSTCSTLNQVLARSAQPHSQRASARFVGECRALIVAPRVAATDHEPGPSGHGD